MVITEKFNDLLNLKYFNILLRRTLMEISILPAIVIIKANKLCFISTAKINIFWNMIIQVNCDFTKL